MRCDRDVPVGITQVITAFIRQQLIIRAEVEVEYDAEGVHGSYAIVKDGFVLSR